MGSLGPVRIETASPQATAPAPYHLVANGDSLLDKGHACAKEIWARASWPVDVVTGIGGMMVIGASFVVAAIGYIVSLYARLALAIVLAIGPIFVALAMFQATRRFAEAWIYSLDGLYVSSAYSDDANTHEENATASVGELPAYWIWNTAIEREFKLQDASVLTASAGISNLFDRQYYFRGIDTSPLGRQPAPGRTLTLGVNYRF